MVDTSPGTPPSFIPLKNFNSVRRRELFPSTDEDSSDDLDNLSPLSMDSSGCENDQFHSSTKFTSKLSDYELLEYIHRSYAAFEVLFDNKTDSLDESEEFTQSFDDSITSNETPSRYIPSITLKTPEDAVTTIDHVPKLSRKSPFGEVNNCSTKSEKCTVSDSALVSHMQKTDHSSKVRTALFPKFDITVPVSIFYSNSDNCLPLALDINADAAQKHKRKSTLHLCSRKVIGKKRFGEINAGVRHKIKKPKPKKVISNIMEGCTAPLLEYLNDLKDLTCTSKQIQENIKVDKSLHYVLYEPECKPVLSESNINIIESKDDCVVSLNNKRKGSPPPKSNKKFFKHRRGNATVTVDERVKFVFDEGKLTLLENNILKENKKVTQVETFDLEEFENDNLVRHEEIQNIILYLNGEDECKHQPVLKPYLALSNPKHSTDFNITQKSDGKENTIMPDKNSILLSPTTQMCNMTSGLALNSPTKPVCNLNNILNIIGSDTEKEKLFPVFYGPSNPPPKPAKINRLGTVKKLKRIPKDQMLLDAGQKNFGATQCVECKFVYHMGDVNDELMHEQYHSAASVLHFNGWKDEQVIGRLENARIIRVLPCDPRPWLKKVKELLDLVNRDLGYYDMEMYLENSQVYIYVAQKTIIGCLVAEPKTIGYRMLSDNADIDLCSEIGYPIKCGVSRVWVAQAHRQLGVGRALLNCLRANFLYGAVLTESDMALSSPTAAGKAFAIKYFNTPNFLVYFP